MKSKKALSLSIFLLCIGLALGMQAGWGLKWARLQQASEQVAGLLRLELGLAVLWFLMGLGLLAYLWSRIEIKG